MKSCPMGLWFLRCGLFPRMDYQHLGKPQLQVIFREHFNTFYSYVLAVSWFLFRGTCTRNSLRIDQSVVLRHQSTGFSTEAPWDDFCDEIEGEHQGEACSLEAIDPDGSKMCHGQVALLTFPKQH